MRDLRVIVREYDGHIITIARSAPIETTLIVRRIGNFIEPLSILKQKAADVLGANTTVPNVAPPVSFF